MNFHSDTIERPCNRSSLVVAGIIDQNDLIDDVVRDDFLIRLAQGQGRIISGHDDDDFLSFQHETEEAGRRIRTDDLLITNQLLYQLSYAGICRRRLGWNAA